MSNAEFLKLPPISERVLELLQIPKDIPYSPGEIEGVLAAGCAAWNMAIIKKRGIHSLSIDAAGAPDREMLIGLIEGLSLRKEKLYPDDSRIILGFEIKRLGPTGPVDFSVSSIQSEHCFHSDGSVVEGLPSGNVLRWEEVSHLFGKQSRFEH